MKYADLVRKDSATRGCSYKVSFRTSVPAKGGPVSNHFHFSSDYLEELGWRKSDKIRIVLTEDGNAVGFKKVDAKVGSKSVRSLTPDGLKENSFHLTATGDYGLPFIRNRVELKVLDEQVDGFTFAVFPDQKEEQSDSDPQGTTDPLTEQLDSIEAEPAKSQEEVDAEEAEIMAKLADL